MNTYPLDKIKREYNPDHDMGPDAPVHWSVNELATMVEQLVAEVEELRARVEKLENRAD